MTVKKVLVVSHDTVGAKMAGPGMRYHQIAMELSKHFEVTLAAFKRDYVADQRPGLPYETKFIEPRHFQRQFDEVDAIVALKLEPAMVDYAKRNGKLLVFDVYTPVPVEDLISRAYSEEKIIKTDDLFFADTLKLYRLLLHSGDFFLCSNERQRDFWISFAFGAGLITPSTYREDPIDAHFAITGMGTDLSEKVDASAHKLRKKIKAKPDDVLLVWTGGIWNWFDARLAVEAMDQLRDKPQIKLVFLATKHPNDDIQAMSEGGLARAKAEELGLLDKSVFFIDGWLPYDERLEYFADADAAVFFHKSPLEAEFSHRTRVLDHILVGLPTVCSRGDYLSEVIEQRGLGLTIEPGDLPAAVKAFAEIAEKKRREAIRKNILAVRSDFSWEISLRPLTAFLLDPKPRLAGSKLSLSGSFIERYYHLGRILPKPFRRGVKGAINRAPRRR